MVVGFKPSEQKKGENEEKEKKFTDFVPIAIPDTRKKKFGCGAAALLASMVIVIVVVMAIGITGYFAGEGGKGNKRAKIHCGPDWENRYHNPHMHGHRWCDTKEKHHSGEEVESYEDFKDIIDNVPRDYEELIRFSDGIFYVEIEGHCNGPKTYAVLDTKKGYTVIKTKYAMDSAYHCAMIDNKAFLDDIHLESISEFDYNEDVAQFNLKIKALFAHFFEYGERVPTDIREDLDYNVEYICPASTPMYYLISGDESFRAQVGDLMEAHDVQYDDIFESFVDIYEAVKDLNFDGLGEILDDFLENVFFLPDGYYGGHESPSGIGWSLNINTTSYYHMQLRLYSMNYQGTLLPQPVTEPIPDVQ